MALGVLNKGFNIDTEIAKRFLSLCNKLVDFVEERNKKIKQTESVKITHKKGCS